jgi:osmotically-inducible protein OsmY
MKTDSQLQQDVMAEPKWEPPVPAAQIGLEVKNGLVTLDRAVNSSAEKLNAERATQRVSGVKALAVELKVKLSEFGQRTDADMARSAETKLSWMGSVPTGAVKVLVESGWITLSGDVEWPYQRQAAAEAVRYLSGVVGVSNSISIKPAFSATLVKADIDAALKRFAAELANRSDWGSSGIGEVVNKMHLVY